MPATFDAMEDDGEANERKRHRAAGDAASSAATLALTQGGRGGGGKRGGRGRGMSSEHAEGKVMQMVIKQLLKVSLHQRDADSILYDVLLMPSDHAVVKAMAMQTKQYGLATSREGKGHRFGPPHVWAWGGLLRALKDMGDSVGVKNAGGIKQAFDELESMSTPEEKDEVCKYCRAEGTYKEGVSRLSLHIVPSSVRIAVLAALEQVGADRRVGRAPAGHYERELQKVLG